MGLHDLPACGGADPPTLRCVTGENVQLTDLLYHSDVRGFRAPGIVSHLKLHTVAIVKDLGALDLALVDEYVFAPIGRSNESEPLGRIEPFHGALHNRNTSVSRTKDRAELKQTLFRKDADLSTMCSFGDSVTAARVAVKQGNFFFLRIQNSLDSGFSSRAAFLLTRHARGSVRPLGALEPSLPPR